MFKLAILLFVFVALALSASAAKSLLITLPDGKVQGAAYTTILNNVTYYGWRGIPFAAPPIGKLRFEAPQPPQPWTGVLNVTTDGKSCLNLIELDFDTQSEDCLFINVYVPSVMTTDKLSVMFWIYGGGFQGGSGEKSSFGPDYLIEENVIVVTHNYRVGPMGFLSTGDTAIRGNAGLKDQVLAMQWTKNNIGLFGGDPEKITIFGESAGGQSVGLHLVSKKSAGLFRAAIVQSGSGLTNSSATLNPEIYTFRLANLIPGGSYGNSTKKLAEFLRNCTANEIYTAANLITGQDIDAWPVVEVGGKDAFLTDSPYVLYESGNFNQVPAMMGICAEEGLMEKESAQEMAIMLDADPTVLIPLDLRPENESDKERIAAIIKSIYLQDGVTFASNLTGVIKLAVQTADDLIISLPDGKVRGTTYLTPNNKTYYGFQGIPFASPPIGNLRFEAPQPPKPWEGILDANKESKACISVTHWQNPEEESEDCLYINIYTPSLKTAESLPVMVWIYGGGYTAGNSSKSLYGPDFLVEKDVIVVTFNYRVGPFGFLSTGDTAIRGNFGLKDQNFAMQWTFKNIKYFGGNPKKITLFGQSAGGASTSFHLLSKKSTGLFRAAIVESGSALAYWPIDENPIEYALLLANALSGSSYVNNTQNLKRFLQEKTAEELINATISITKKQVWPNIEVEGDDSFLNEYPYKLLETGNFNQVPIIIGFCAEESLMFLQDLGIARLAALAFDFFPSMLIPSNLQQNDSDKSLVITAIKNIYLKEGETFFSNLVALVEYFTDNLVTRGIIKQAELTSSYVPVYLYQFAYYGRVITPAYINGAEKAAHAAELPFVFNIADKSNTTDLLDITTQNRMVNLWTNFAKFLNPTPDQDTLLNNTIWPTFSPLSLQYLNINSTLEVRSNMKITTYLEWNKIYETYGKKPFITF